MEMETLFFDNHRSFQANRSLFIFLATGSYRLDDVLNEEGGCAHVVDVAVEEAEALLGEEVHRDDVVEAALDQHLGDQLHRDVAASSHLG